MNKKISTLLCASLLLSSAFTTVSAADLTGIANGLDASAVVKLDKTALAGVYQLRVTSEVDGNTTNGVLAIENGKYVVKANGYNLQNSLWCIKITEQGQGKEPIYDFINKATNEFLAIAESDVQGLTVGQTSGALSVGETYGGWAFARTYATQLEKNQPMFTYQEADHVLILKEVGGKLFATKVLASSARNLADAVKFTVYDAGTYVLSADEINGYLKDNKDVLTFNLDANADVNPFSKNPFVAKASTGNQSTDHNFVYVTAKSNGNSYLKVDTAANGVGIQFLKFGWTDATKETAGNIENSVIAGQHKFLFTYKPSTDKLFIQVQEARYKTEKAPEKTWKEVVDGAGVTYRYGANYADVNASDAAMDAVNLNSNPSKLFVKLQNFTVADRIATIGERPINTVISFGLKGCTPVESDKTSLANGLYIIKNAKGQVLAAPVHENAEMDRAYEWVTLDEQDPLHMPAYQWVITKTLSSVTAQATSPIKILNREFPTIDNGWTNVQLRMNEKGEIFTSDASATMLAKGITYEQIKDKAILSNKKLGYKHIASQDLQLTKYRFNYLNPFTQDYWIANGDGKDSLVYVKKSAAEYTLVEGSTSTYGITVDAALLTKIPDLAQLERTHYAIAQGSKRLVKAYGSKFSMGSANYSTIAEVDSFFFKENNHFNGNHYYAILETSFNSGKAIIEDTDITSKVGIADDGMTAGLKVQLLNESRTSSFTVEPSTTPLYRRFNSATLKENADDSADTLSFVESIRHEYLMDEMNGNLLNATTDYAGIWAKDKSKGLSFHVDTAWVKRGFGYIKPQYLISVDRHEVAAIPGVPCTYTHNHYDNEGHQVDAAHCSHATQGQPGYNVAKYLVSFADSIAKDNANKPKYTDVKGGYTRVGFVKAIQEGDSLYFLVNGFEKKAKEDVSVAEVVAAYKKANIYDTYVRPLTEDVHKNYTWSFRYVNPEKAANEVEADRSFLIESNIYDANEKAIAPEKAAWLKMQNGYLVLTDMNSTFSNTKTGGDGALVFNVDNEANDQLATDNEGVTTSEVSVIAGEGQVTIAGAAGKNVVITNILGQVVANTVLSSSDATIAVSAGVVVVAVEGEAAVKAIVK